MCSRGCKIPLASTHPEAAFVVPLPVIQVAKIMLWNAMCDEGISRAELARRLQCTRVVATRLVDLSHPSKVGAVECALDLLGRRLSLVMEKVPRPPQLPSHRGQLSARGAAFEVRTGKHKCSTPCPPS